MTTFYDNDLIEQWRNEARPRMRPRMEPQIDRNYIFNREFKSRLLANGAKESLLARKILIEMYVDKLNRAEESGTKWNDRQQHDNN